MSEKKAIIQVVVNASQAENAMKMLTELAAKQTEQLKKLVAAGKMESQEAKELQMSIKSLNSAVVASQTNMQHVAEVTQRLGTTSTNELKKAKREAQSLMGTLDASNKDLSKVRDALAKIQGQIDKNTGSVNKHGSAWKSAVKNIVAYVGVFGAFNAVKNKMQEIIRLNLDLSDQIANVRKVSGLAMNDINNLYKSLAKVDTRTSMKELMDISYEGAKLGFGDYGVAGLESFTKAANVINVALKEDLGPEALTSVSKIVETMGLIKKMGVEKSMLATGSAMFKLAASSTATANNIVEFTKRLIPMAQAANMTTDQVLALGSASDSLYLQPEVASTSFSKLISAFQTNHNLIEKELDIPEGTLNRMYKSKQVMEGLVLIFEKMHEKGNMNALNSVFKDLGSDGARLKSVMVAMANHVDLLKTHLNTSTTAFKDATAASAEYAIQQSTSNAIMERASNMWNKALVNPDEIDVVHDFAKAWYDLSKQLTSSQFFMAQVRAVISLLMFSLKELIAVGPTLILTFGATGIIMIFQSVAKALSEASTGAKTLRASFIALDMTTKATIIGVAIGLLLQLGIAIYDAASKANQASKFMDGFTKSTVELERQSAVTAYEVKGLTNEINRAKRGSQERNAAINDFNQKYGRYLKNLLTESSTVNDVANAYNRVVKALRAKMALELMDKDKQTYVAPRLAQQANRLYSYGQYEDKNNTGFSTNSLKAYAEDIIASKKINWKQIGADIAARIPSEGNINVQNLVKWRSKPQDWLKETNPNDKSSYIKITSADMQRFAAIKYISQALSTQKADTEVYNKWHTFTKGVNLNPADNDPTGGLNNDAKDQAAIKAAKAREAALRKARAAQLRKDREAFKNAKDSTTTLLDAIEEYYTLQENALQQMYIDGKITSIQANNMKLSFEEKKQNMLKEARYAMTNQTNKFGDLRNNMGWGKDRLDSSDKSDNATAKIMAANPETTYKTLSAFTGKNGEPDGRSELNKISKDAAKDEAKIQDQRVKLLENIERYNKSFEFVTQAQDSLATSFTEMGIMNSANPTFFNAAKNTYDVDQKNKAREKEGDLKTVDLPTAEIVASAAKPPFQRMLDQFIKKDTTKYDVDTRDMNSMGDWLKNFATNGSYGDRNNYMVEGDMQSWTSMFPDMKAWIKDVPKYEDQIKAFYLSLMNYEDQYYQKLKEESDREKKIIDSKWDHSEDKLKLDKQASSLKQRSSMEKMMGDGYDKGLGYKMGFADNISNSTSVQEAQNENDSATAQYDIAKKQPGVNSDVLQQYYQQVLDSETKLNEAINAQIDERAALLQKWMDPIEQFGTSMGEAFSKMTDNAKEGRDAVKQSFKEMASSYTNGLAKMLKDEMMHQVKLAILQKATAKQKKKAEADNTDITKNAAKQQIGAKSALATGMSAINTQMTADISKETNKQTTKNKESSADDAKTSVFGGIAAGAGKIIAKLGFWGIPLVAVITALLNGLLSMALGKIMGSGSKSDADASVNTKLTTGMLTYDAGNVQSFKGIKDGQTYPVVGNDGKVYAAGYTDSLSTGLITKPVATMVNGNPSLIAENGPELIIGRETTHAMMMNRPDLVKQIVDYDKNRSGMSYKAYDAGNVQSVLPDATALSSSSSQDNTQLVETIQQMQSVMVQLQDRLQQPLYINMYGPNGIYKSMEQANKFYKGKS